MAILDTGACISCVPPDVAQALDNGTMRYGIRDVRGATGSEATLETCYINIEVANKVFNSHEVLILDRPYAIIGRDILNKYCVTLDGIALEWFINRKYFGSSH